MFQLVQNWFERGSNPIGIDFGTDCLRMAQVELRGRDAQLVAAASVDVPAPVRDDPVERLSFLTDAVADLVRTEQFRGRRAVLALPAAMTFIQHFRIDAADDVQLRDRVLNAVQSVLPMDASELLVRHQAVNAVEDMRDVIAVGTQRSAAAGLLAAVQAAGLDVVAMNTEPGAICDFHNHVYRRYADRESTTWLIDLGYSGSRVFAVRDQKLLMACATPFGGRHLTQAVADALHLTTDAARMLRLKHSRVNATSVSVSEQHVLYVAPPSGGVDAMQREHAVLELACMPVVESLCRMMRQFRDDFQHSDLGSPIDRLLFIGGESRDRRLCERIARNLGVTACIGDPLLRMGRVSDVCVASGIDRRQPQPAWATAIGLSLGPASVEVLTETNSGIPQDANLNR